MPVRLKTSAARWPIAFSPKRFVHDGESDSLPRSEPLLIINRLNARGASSNMLAALAARATFPAAPVPNVRRFSGSRAISRPRSVTVFPTLPRSRPNSFLRSVPVAFFLPVMPSRSRRAGVSIVRNNAPIAVGLDVASLSYRGLRPGPMIGCMPWRWRTITSSVH